MKKSRKTAVLIISLAAIAACAAVYFLACPALISRQHADEVKAATRPLRKCFKSLEESTELPLLADSIVTEEVGGRNLVQISQLASECRQRISLLKIANENFDPLPFSNIFGQYRSSEVLHDHATLLVAQSEEAISRYEIFANEISIFHKAMNSTLRELNIFNSEPDLNIYTGQSDNVRRTAQKIRTEAGLLSGRNLNDTRLLFAVTGVTFSEAANGFDDLALGLAIPADDPIYAGAHTIEGATTKLELIVNKTYYESISQSRSIKNIQDLNEKIEMLAEM